MKFITIRKNLEYDPTCGGKYSKYQGYCLIEQRVENPGIIPGQRLITAKKETNIFCSTRRRALESVEEGSRTELLDEIGFNLKKLLTEEEYEKHGSMLVRKRFIDRFLDDGLEEKGKQIKERMDKLLIKIPNNSLLISHSFFMKIFETYILERELFKNPRILSGYLNPQNRTYNFGEGFEIKI